MTKALSEQGGAQLLKFGVGVGAAEAALGHLVLRLGEPGYGKKLRKSGECSIVTALFVVPG
jgi:hypothetical protein